MKIGPQDKAGLADGALATSRAETGLAPQARASLARAADVAGALSAAGRGTEVVLSEAATALASAQASLSSDVDIGKVQRMQAALAQGQYRVNPEAIADQLIADAQAFLQPQRR